MREQPVVQSAAIKPRQFIEIWQTSESLAEVAERCHATKPTCRVRAFRYRQRGVPLKVFPPIEIEEIDWQDLADYAEELLPPSSSEARQPEVQV